MSESSYKDGEVVWVKWGNVWWPGEVWDNSRVPEDIISSLRKPVIAFVKFFQEETFEFVRSPNNICQYNSEKKMEYIKKGMTKFRSNNKIMTNFPADVVKAEQLTNGNVNILNTLETPEKIKSSSSSNLGTSSDSTKKVGNLSMTVSTPVLSKKAVGSYNSSVKVQNTTSPAPKSSDKKLTCTMCNFATDRMNLLMMHIKNHSITILSRVNSSSSLDIRRPIVPKTSTRNKEMDDGIADDVRKIKESMKDPTTSPTTSSASVSASTKKTRTPASAKSTPKLKQSRQSRKDKKVDKNSNKDEEKEEIGSLVKKVEDKEEINKPKSTNTELKKELLADWMDEEDVKVEDTTDEKKTENEIIQIPESKPEPVVPEKPIENPIKPVEKATINSTSTGEVSRSIRNIPKKQRVSEIYIQPEQQQQLQQQSPEKVELSNSIMKHENINKPVVESTILKKPETEDISSNDVSSTTFEINKKFQQPKASKRKHVASDDSSNEPEKKKLSEESDEKILMATAELLNETEVPKLSNVQSPSTFHSNDIDKRYLPPKERNKRIFRARNSPETVSHSVSIVTNPTTLSPVSISMLEEKPADEKNAKISTEIEDNNKEVGVISAINEDVQQIPPIVNNKNDRQELMLPHKKKQSSRLLTADKISPVSESPKTTVAETTVKQQEHVITNSRPTANNNNNNNNKKNRKSNDSQNSIDCDKLTVTVVAAAANNNKNDNVDNDDVKTTSTVAKPTQSPLRETTTELANKCPSPKYPLKDSLETTVTSSITSTECIKKRSQKRPLSREEDSRLSDKISAYELLQPESKKLHKSESAPRKIVACSNETICITSMGTLSVAKRDSIKTTTCSSVVVTSQVIITEATTKPIVSSKSSTLDTISSSSSQNSISSPISSQTSSQSSSQSSPLKSALKFPKESIEELKKQGLLTFENNRTKLTPKGRQKFKEYQSENNLVPVVTLSSSDSSLGSKFSSESLTMSSSQSSSGIDSRDEYESQEDSSQRTSSESPETVIAVEPAQKSPQKDDEKVDTENVDILKTEDDKKEVEENASTESSNNKVENQKNEEMVVEEMIKRDEEEEKDEIVKMEIDETQNNDEIDNADENKSSRNNESLKDNNIINSNSNSKDDENTAEMQEEEEKMVVEVEKSEEIIADKTNSQEVEEKNEEERKACSSDTTMTVDEKFEKSTKKEAESDDNVKTEEIHLEESSTQESETLKLTECTEKEMKEEDQEVEAVEEEEEVVGSEQIVFENGKDDSEELVAKDDDDANPGLIALQAENFGGPPNCFYLCKQIEDRYEPVNNQILILNAQNALVPYDGPISELGLVSADAVQENLSAYSQLSPNSNIIISTQSGQKIELSHQTIMELQEQAGQNGIASIELAGETIEINISAIFEALSAQQEIADSTESIIPGTVLLEGGDGQLIIDADIPIDIHHPSVATQVSETLSKPIMSTTVAPEIAINPTKPSIVENVSRTLNIEDSLASIGVTTQRADVPKSLELPITVTNPKIAETVNHRKLTASLGTDIVAESFVVQQSADNGSDD